MSGSSFTSIGATKKTALSHGARAVKQQLQACGEAAVQLLIMRTGIRTIPRTITLRGNSGVATCGYDRDTGRHRPLKHDAAWA